MKVNELLIDDPRFPENLKEIPDPPSCLYFVGNLELFERRRVAIVGTRKSTPYGESFAHQFAKELSQAGICVVSGLAYGIDAIAHQGALKGEGGTIAVLAQALPEIRPVRHKRLAETIVEKGGLLISEQAKEEPFNRTDYLVRNRLISGLSEGVLVVEAAYRSGALNTANHALDQNRYVMAVPGRINDEFSGGTNRLIHDGAALIRSTEDIADFLNIKLKRKVNVELSGPQKELYELLLKEPQSGAELGEKFHGKLSELYNLLAELEMNGLVKFSNSNRYVACGGRGGSGAGSGSG